METAHIQLPWPDWRIVRELGHGGYGAVYQAERQLSGVTEEAAIKVISFPGSRDEIEADLTDGYDIDSIRAKYTERLQIYVNEYNIMKGLKGQTNIVSCDDFATVPHADSIGWDVFIRMELLTPLTRVIRERQLAVPEIVKIGKDICRALMLCESVNVIHRDIKPENIMVSRFGDYKLGDFGIAKTMDHTTNATMVGTERYMAPEVIRREPYGKEVDLYSLGLVLYWLLNNRKMPFISADRQPGGTELNEAQARRVRGEPLPPPRDGSEALKQVILKACAFRPEDRYHSAREMYEALAATERGQIEEEDEESHTLPVWNAHRDQTAGSTSGPPSGGMARSAGAKNGMGRPAGEKIDRNRPAGAPGSPDDDMSGTETIPLYRSNGQRAPQAAGSRAGGSPGSTGKDGADQDLVNGGQNRRAEKESVASKVEKSASNGSGTASSGAQKSTPRSYGTVSPGAKQSMPKGAGTVSSGGEQETSKAGGTHASGQRQESQQEDTQTATLLGSYPDDGYLKIIKVFLIIGCVTMGAGTMGIGLLWCIPITVSIFRKMKKHEPIGTGMKVAVLLLVNLVSGILMLAKENI